MTVKASFTVEAAFVCTILLLVVGGIMRESIRLYQQMEKTASESAVEQLEAVDYFERSRRWKSLISDD